MKWQIEKYRELHQKITTKDGQIQIKVKEPESTIDRTSIPYKKAEAQPNEAVDYTKASQCKSQF